MMIFCLLSFLTMPRSWAAQSADDSNGKLIQLRKAQRARISNSPGVGRFNTLTN